MKSDWTYIAVPTKTLYASPLFITIMNHPRAAMNMDAVKHIKIRAIGTRAIGTRMSKKTGEKIVRNVVPRRKRLA